MYPHRSTLYSGDVPTLSSTLEDVKATLFNFGFYAAHYWTLSDKSGKIVPFNLNRCQRVLDAEYERQMDERGFVRMNVLKLRQGGVTTWATGRATHFVHTNPSTALTLAHDDKLPPVWLARCRMWRDMTPEIIRPHVGTTQRNELSYDLMPSENTRVPCIYLIVLVCCVGFLFVTGCNVTVRGRTRPLITHKRIRGEIVLEAERQIDEILLGIYEKGISVRY